MSSTTPASGPFTDIVEESFDEAAFLLGRWERELTSLTRNLAEVWSWTEDRLHGAIDGVRMGGAAAVDLAAAGIGSGEPERAAIGAGVLASIPEPRAVEVLTAAIGAAEPDALAAIVRGLELFGVDRGLRAAAAALPARGPAGAAALCRLKAFHRAPIGDEALAAFASKIPEFQIAALRAAAHGGAPQLDQALPAAIESADPGVRAAAIESGLYGAIPVAWPAAVRHARAADPSAAPYLRWMALLGNGDDHEVVYAALRVPALQVAAIQALGHLGTPRAVEACLAGMRHEKLARACGEAYAWITGADLVRDRLEKIEQAPDAPPIEADDLDANLVPAPEDLWPLPDADAVAADWQARAGTLTADVRHIHSRPVTGEVLLSMIESSPMLRRPDLVFELRARTRGKYDVETRAFAARQRRMMASARAAATSQGGR